MSRAGEAVARCDVLAPTITDKIDTTLMPRRVRLKLIANFRAG